MGLLKMSGDTYSLYDDTKIAANAEGTLPIQGDVAAMDPAVPAPNPVPDALPTQVNAGLKAPMEEVKPQESLVPRNIYVPTPDSLPQIKTNSYRGARMSKLKELLYKQAMTQSDLDQSYYGMEEDPYASQGTLGGRENIEQYNVPSDYSNYMAASAGTPSQDSYDIGSADMDAMYSDAYPEDTSMSMYEQPQEEYSAYAPSSYGAYDDYSSMGYSPEVMSRYEQMYASPEAADPGYTDMAVSATPEEQQLAKEHAAYEQSYNEIYNYLVQMGYSAEEAAAAAPSLLQQVSVAPPQQQKQAHIKVASQTFKQAGDQAVYQFVQAGYSPYQAQQMAIEIVVPQAEKYASMQARALGGIAGGVLGGLGGHSAYDDDGEIGGGLASAALGAGLGALVGGRVPRYLTKSHMGDLGSMRAHNLKQQRQMARDLGVVDPMHGAKVDQMTAAEIQTAMRNQGILANDKLRKAQEAGKALKHDEYATVVDGAEPFFQDQYRYVAQDMARGNLKSDLGTAAKVVIPAAIPAYVAHSALSQDGGDNFVDNAFGIGDNLGAYAASAGAMLDDIDINPRAAALYGTGAAGLAGTAALANALYNRSPETKKTKKKKKVVKEAMFSGVRARASQAKDAVKNFLAPYAERNIIGAGTGGFAGYQSADDDAPFLSKALSGIAGAAIGDLALRRRHIPEGLPTRLGEKIRDSAIIQGLKENPRILVGAGLGGYAGAEAGMGAREFYHEPVEFGNTELYLRRPSKDAQVEAALLGAGAGIIGGGLLSAAVKPGAILQGMLESGKGVGQSVAGKVSDTAKNVGKSVSGKVSDTAKKVMEAPTISSALTGAASGGLYEGTLGDGDVTKGILAGGAGGALMGRLVGSKASPALAAALYPTADLASEGLKKTVATSSSPEAAPVVVPQVTESTLDALESRGINPYLAGGLGGLGAAGLIYGAGRLLSDDRPVKRITNKKGKA